MKINLELIQVHKQLYEDSCIPMSVECVLKLLNLMPIDDFSLQSNKANSRKSDWVKGYKHPYSNSKVKFSREFELSDYGVLPVRGDHFIKDYFEDLFKTIDNELACNRFVIISLDYDSNFHMEVIFNKINDNEYETITYSYKQPIHQINKHNLRQRVLNLKGTDILTYKLITP